jgi:hypothetical protein
MEGRAVARLMIGLHADSPNEHEKLVNLLRKDAVAFAYREVSKHGGLRSLFTAKFKANFKFSRINERMTQFI